MSTDFKAVHVDEQYPGHAVTVTIQGPYCDLGVDPIVMKEAEDKLFIGPAHIDKLVERLQRAYDAGLVVGRGIEREEWQGGAPYLKGKLDGIKDGINYVLPKWEATREELQNLITKGSR